MILKLNEKKLYCRDNETVSEILSSIHHDNRLHDIEFFDIALTNYFERRKKLSFTVFFDSFNSDWNRLYSIGLIYNGIYYNGKLTIDILGELIHSIVKYVELPLYVFNPIEFNMEVRK